jgi:hypothetical protein
MRKIYHKKCKSPTQLSSPTVLCTIEVQDNRCCDSSRSEYVLCIIEMQPYSIQTRTDHIKPVGFNFNNRRNWQCKSITDAMHCGKQQSERSERIGGCFGVRGIRGENWECVKLIFCYEGYIQ